MHRSYANTTTFSMRLEHPECGISGGFGYPDIPQISRDDSTYTVVEEHRAKKEIMEMVTEGIRDY